MPWGYAIVGGASVYSADKAGDASDAIAGGQNLSIEEKRRQFDLIRKDTRLTRMSGDKARIAMNDMMGIDTDNPFDKEVKDLQDSYNSISGSNIDTGMGILSVSPSSVGLTEHPDLKEAAGKLSAAKEKQAAFKSREKYDFKGSPGYEFRLSEGQKGVERMQAGRRFGGRALKESIRYGQGFASREYGAQFNRLSQIAGAGSQAVGQSAANQPNYSGEYSTIGSAGAGDAAAKNEAVQGGLANAFAWSEYNQGQGNGGGTSSGSLY